MSFSGLLPHTVQVYRRVESSPGVRAVDRFGQEKSQNPRQHVTDGETLIHTYPGRAYMTTGGLAFAERAVDSFERQFKVFLDIGCDIREDDAIRVLGATGEVVFGLAKVKDSSVIYNSGTAHHIELTAWEQSGPRDTNV